MRTWVRALTGLIAAVTDAPGTVLAHEAPGLDGAPASRWMEREHSQREPQLTPIEQAALKRAAADLPPTEQAVLLALLDQGPSSASSPDLQAALRIGRSRLARVLRRLEDQGLVVAHDEHRRDGPGRPHRVYAPALSRPEPPTRSQGP